MAFFTITFFWLTGLFAVLAALLIIHTIAVVVAWIALRLMGTPARLRDVWHRF